MQKFSFIGNSNDSNGSNDGDDGFYGVDDEEDDIFQNKGKESQIKSLARPLFSESLRRKIFLFLYTSLFEIKREELS